MQVGIVTIIPVNVMLGIEFAEHLPGVDQRTFLNVQLIEPVIELEVVTAFITIVPKNNRRMIAVMRDHFLCQDRTNLRIVCFVSAAQFIEHH